MIREQRVAILCANRHLQTPSSVFRPELGQIPLRIRGTGDINERTCQGLLRSVWAGSVKTCRRKRKETQKDKKRTDATGIHGQ